MLGFRNFGYDFWGVGGDVWRWLCRHLRRKISAHVDGGPSVGSRVPRPGSEDPHRREQKFSTWLQQGLWQQLAPVSGQLFVNSNGWYCPLIASCILVVEIRKTTSRFSVFQHWLDFSPWHFAYFTSVLAFTSIFVLLLVIYFNMHNILLFV